MAGNKPIQATALRHADGWVCGWMSQAAGIIALHWMELHSLACDGLPASAQIVPASF